MDQKTRDMVLRDTESIDDTYTGDDLLSKSISFKISTLQPSVGNTPGRAKINDSNMISDEMTN